MSVSLYVPISVSAATRDELTKKMLKVQAIQGGKVSVISISQDYKTLEWVCWYYPIKNLGGGLL